MLVYKVDILQELKKAGYNQGVLRRNHIIGDGSLVKLRRGLPVGINELTKICELLRRQPGAILEWIPDGSPEAEEEQRRRDSIRGDRA